MRPLRTVLPVAVLALAAFGGAAGAEPVLVPSSTVLNLANRGPDCSATDGPFLTTGARTNDINCGYIGGGLPFGEVFHTAEPAGVKSTRTFATSAEQGGVPLLLDTSRDVSGKVTVRRGSLSNANAPGVSQPLPGGGQIVAEIALRVADVDGNVTDLGAQDLEVVATPGGERVELPFTFDIPAAVAGVQITDVAFDLNIRGVHVGHGFMELNGKTAFTVPTLIEEQPAAS